MFHVYNLLSLRVNQTNQNFSKKNFTNKWEKGENDNKIVLLLGLQTLEKDLNNRSLKPRFKFVK